MSTDLTFLEEKGIDTELGKEYTGGKEKYLSALKRYYSGYESNRKKLEHYYGMRDLENFMIQAHALKSNSKMVGAVGLSEDFEALERAAAGEDGSFIADNLEKILLKYSEFVELIRPIGEADIEKPADEIDSEEAKKISDELLEALDDYDDEKSLELVKKLSGYPFRLSRRSELKRAIELIEGFGYDDAADIIRKISETIE